MEMSKWSLMIDSFNNLISMQIRSRDPFKCTIDGHTGRVGGGEGRCMYSYTF